MDTNLEAITPFKHTLRVPLVRRTLVRIHDTVQKPVYNDLLHVGI